MKHYTTIEQSKKLLELRLNPETADMAHIVKRNDCRESWELAAEDPGNVYTGLKYSIGMCLSDYALPCWSLGALLEVMPEQITYSDFKPFLLGLFKGNKEEHSKYGHYWIQYFATDSGGAHVQTNGHSPIEAAYSMVVWLLENEYIK